MYENLFLASHHVADFDPSDGSETESSRFTDTSPLSSIEHDWESNYAQLLLYSTLNAHLSINSARDGMGSTRWILTPSTFLMGPVLKLTVLLASPLPLDRFIPSLRRYQEENDWNFVTADLRSRLWRSTQPGQEHGDRTARDIEQAICRIDTAPDHLSDGLLFRLALLRNHFESLSALVDFQAGNFDRAIPLALDAVLEYRELADPNRLVASPDVSMLIKGGVQLGLYFMIGVAAGELGDKQLMKSAFHYSLQTLDEYEQQVDRLPVRHLYLRGRILDILERVDEALVHYLGAVQSSSSSSVPDVLIQAAVRTVEIAIERGTPDVGTEIALEAQRDLKVAVDRAPRSTIKQSVIKGILRQAYVLEAQSALVQGKFDAHRTALTRAQDLESMLNTTLADRIQTASSLIEAWARQDEQLPIMKQQKELLALASHTRAEQASVDAAFEAVWRCCAHGSVYKNVLGLSKLVATGIENNEEYPFYESTPLTAELKRAQMIAYYSLGQVIEAEALATELLVGLTYPEDPIEGRVLVDAYLVRAGLEMTNNRFHAAVASAERAIHIAKAADNPTSLLSATRVMAELKISNHSSAQMLQQLKEYADSDTFHLAAPWAQSMYMRMIANLSILLDYPDDAESALSSVFWLIDTNGLSIVHRAAALRNLIVVRLLEEGEAADLEDLIATAEEILEINEQVGLSNTSRHRRDLHTLSELLFSAGETKRYRQVRSESEQLKVVQLPYDLRLI